MSIKVRSVTTGPFQENTYFIGLEKPQECLIIDPGDETDVLIKEIESYGKPVAMLCTHAHLDHIGSAHALKKKYECPVYMHQQDKPVLDWFEDSRTLFGLDPAPKPEIDEWITTEDDLSFGDLTIKVMHTPGHTPGSTCYKIDGHVFTGDTLFAGTVGRTDLPGGSWDELNASLTRLIKTLPHETIIHSGHGPDTTMAVEKEQNPFLIPLLRHVDS